jgi:ferredoxin/flavodoxin---NADP+ reductase
MSKWAEGSVVASRRWTERLYSLQVEADIAKFQAGQFVKLALAVDGEMVARPYSFVNAPAERPHEFYYVLLPEGPLTPRLTRLEAGDAIYLSPQASGFLTLAEVPQGEHLWLLATGTALGPFLSILKTEAPWQRFKRVVLVHAVREARELSYQEQVRSLLAQHAGQFAFVPFVSREETDFAVRGRIPGAIADGRLEQRAAIEFSPAASQVMICGNPEMVRATVHTLQERGLKKHRRRDPGQISVENYW